jgi:ketosteroid isomerase-like protein
VSAERVETVNRIIAAFARGDVDAALRDIDPAAVFEPQRTATEGAFIGHEGMRRFGNDTEEMFDYFHPEYTEVRDLGDSVLAIGTLTVRGRGSGAEVQIPMAFLAEFRDDRVVRMKDFGEVAAALEAAGLA